MPYLIRTDEQNLPLLRRLLERWIFPVNMEFVNFSRSSYHEKFHEITELSVLLPISRSNETKCSSASANPEELQKVVESPSRS